MAARPHLVWTVVALSAFSVLNAAHAAHDNVANMESDSKILSRRLVAVPSTTASDVQDLVSTISDLTITYFASDTLCCYGQNPAAINDGMYDCVDSHGWHSTYSTGAIT